MSKTKNLALLVGVTLALTACAGAAADGTEEAVEVTGVVIDVQGNLQGTDSFTILIEDGSELVLVPTPGLLFEGGPLSHLRDHVLSGAKVKVVYTVEDDGAHIAIEVGDA
ncbi:MAG: hypothetical protein V3U46_04235 [Acidimicrobiia bacterium]